MLVLLAPPGDVKTTHHPRQLFQDTYLSGGEEKRPILVHQHIFGSCLQPSFRSYLLLQCSGADAKQQPRTVTLENDHPIPSYLKRLSRSKGDRDALMQKVLVRSVLMTEILPHAIY